MIERGEHKRERPAPESLAALFAQSPLPVEQLLLNPGLYMSRPTLARILFMHELYRKIVPVHGVVLEFGVRWGQNLALFEAFRGMYEPANESRRIVGFDTFSGFPSTSAADGGADVVTTGAFGVSDDYEEHLDAVLACHERANGAEAGQHELVQGDVTVTLPEYLERHPETVVALAYFDLDLHEPTRACLELIRDRLPKGSVLGFDELCAPAFPGETTALREVLGIGSLRLVRSPTGSFPSYAVID
jgi:hypothetical protein